jgi:catechol 2,3-dioxygenase
LGPVALTVTDLERAISFYEQLIGLRAGDRDDERAHLGSGGDDVVVLEAWPDARPPGRHAGLYHVALLYPSREELARAARRLAATQITIQGASDHGTHEAIYLADPDGNGLELAADRPREQWPTTEELYSHGPSPLDLAGLLAAGQSQDPSSPAAPGLAVGHLHLQVGDIDHGLAFYCDLIGFELQARLPSAAFVSAGGYHHHLGFNTWLGEGIPPMPDDVIGLRYWTLLLPPEDVDRLASRLDAGGVATEPLDSGFDVSDPWNIRLRVASGE